MNEWEIGKDSNQSVSDFDICMSGLSFEQFLYPILGEGNYDLQTMSMSNILPLKQKDILQPTRYTNRFITPTKGYTKLPTLQLFLGSWNHNQTNYFSPFSRSVLQMLKHRQIIIVFNNFSEAWPHDVYNIPMSIENEAIKYGFPLENIVYISGNLHDKQRYMEDSAYKKLNIVSTSYWHVMIHLNNINFDYYTKPPLTDKIYTCLMRKNRPHREMLFDLLDKNDLLKYGSVSFPNKAQVDIPLKNADVFNVLESVHRQCLFSVSAETTSNSTAYTEKIVKPMFCRMPQLIIGNVNANSDLKLAGYQTYEDWFDLSWDSENDLEKRLYCAVEEIKVAVRRLYALTDAEKHAWVNKNTDVLQHNYQQTVNNSECKKVFTDLLYRINL